MLKNWIVRLLRAALPSARALRMAAYAVFAFGVLAVAAGRSVYADVREMGLGLGHQLAKLEDLTGSAYVIRVNGTELHRSSAHTSQPLHAVLDRYEAYCRDNPSALSRAMEDIPSALADRAEVPKDPSLRTAIVREEGEGRGMVACFVEDPRAPSEPLLGRLRALSETGDLSKLGRFRYAFAEPRRSGGTHVVTFWSDGELNLKKMFPEGGDAPGDDSPLAPRPQESRRTLSASVMGYPASVRIYDSRAERGAIERTYDAALRAKGFTKISPSHPSPDAAVYVRGGDAEIFVSFGQSGRRTSVTVVEAAAVRTEGVRVEVP